MTLAKMFLPGLLLLSLADTSVSLNVVIAGGTGTLGPLVAGKLNDNHHSVTILCRNAFLAAAPARVTEAFGWVGERFLERHRGVRLRDWDGGDLLDIVGCDWVGWQEDALKPADVVVNLVGGYTEQRNMATERIVRESLQFNPKALQVTVAPKDEELPLLSPGMISIKSKRLKDCEDMVKNNCRNFKCLRLEANDVEHSVDSIVKAVTSS